MVNAGTYWLWQQLAVSDALPDEALPTVIEALCSTSLAPHGVDGRGEERRTKALAEALPALLSRVTRPGLRRRLLQQADDKQLAELADQGVVVAADLPTILRTHRPTPGLVIGLARHADQVDAAIGLLPGMHDTALEDVVTDWDPNRHLYRPDAEPAPPIPPALVDAVLEHALTPLARLLKDPQHEEWQFAQRVDRGLPHEFGEGAPWRILATCPERWHDLVEHPTLGTAVQHLLLDQAEVEARRSRMMASSSSSLTQDTDDGPAEQPEPEPALDTALLRACLPALCLPEMAGLPKPSVTARHRLHHIANRVRYNPRLTDIAATQLQAAADECVRRGRLLTPPRTDDRKHRAVAIAEDLALLSTNPTHLAKACALLATLEQPAVVSTPPSPRLTRITAGTDLLSPVRLLEHNYQHRRIAALAALAGNPHTPRTAVTDTLSALHPLELAWIGHQNDVPEWLHTAAAALAPADTNEAVLRLLTDEELDRHPDPAAVLQSWLDAPESEGFWSRRDVYRAVLDSRHHTLNHLRQLPADEILTRNEPHLALPHLLALCGTQPQRWTALLKALDYGPTDEKITFGELLDGIQDPAPASAV
ncbi:hypothetical protein OOK44_35535 [Streptomyces cellulosae]|uniref:Uncharacterized protein n=1 Tax=Streptomyces althioticus TaxID=83380 RepID=A0ABZ1YFY9_9ACTN|nr:hypothetical protein [Streptomyces cellulosae]WTB86489.1 hypothetical protein OG837_35005 [Streptomyces cellulosae]WTB93315.1 hypothetical protein OIE99_34285 [Streptomyces cellulosae]WTC60707.1 hypothetical protein OH715_36040 [Streptomyces cellulosae]